MKPILHYSRERLKHHRFQVFDFFVPVVPHILDIHLQSTTLFQSVLAIETTAANCHDSKLLLVLLDKADIQPGIRIHADKPYSSQKQRNALKSRGIKNSIQDKAAKNNPLTHRQLQRNSLITKARYVVERTFGRQTCWFNAKALRYRGKASAHAWHLLLAMAYNLKRLPKLFDNRRIVAHT